MEERARPTHGPATTRAALPLLLATLLSTVPPSGLLAQHPGADAVRTAIDLGNAEYIAAYAVADADALARVYDPDGARLSGRGRVARGREAIAASVNRWLERVGPVRVRLETMDLWVIEDRAYETGIWSYTFAPPGDAERTIGGRYVTVWSRQPDGGWRILADLGVPGTTLPEGFPRRETTGTGAP